MTEPDPSPPSNVFVLSRNSRTKYVEILKHEINEIEKAVLKNDLAVVREISHKLKGSAALFGFHEIGMICKTIQDQFKAGTPVELHSFWTQLKSAFTKACPD